VVDPENTDSIYVGTDVGVWCSTDAGGTWTPFGEGLPNAIVGDLLFHPVARVLRAGTRSRGAWEIAVDPAAATPTVQLYLRNSIVDSRRATSSVVDGDDPFQPGVTVNWWSSPDIKVYSKSEIDFESFQNDRGSSDLSGEIVHGPTRVFVQVHNLGHAAAREVIVKVFYADASEAADPPPLPSGFWSDFSKDTVPSDSPWQQLAPRLVVPSVEAGRPQVAGFEWAPPDTPGTGWLFAVVSAANDAVADTEQDVALLVQNNAKCALKRVRVMT
jgi:hypothetical protein